MKVIQSLNPRTVTRRLFTALVSACALALVVGMVGCTSESGADAGQGETAPNTLTDAEREAGWTLLFDGESFDGWTGLGRDAIPAEHWVIEDGTIRKVESDQVPTAEDGQPLEGGDIMTEATYEDFELKFEWRTSEVGNSGIKYNVSESLSTAHEPVHAALGFEYQLLDDERHPDSELPSHRAAALRSHSALSVNGTRPVSSSTAITASTGSTAQKWWSTIWTRRALIRYLPPASMPTLKGFERAVQDILSCRITATTSGSATSKSASFPLRNNARRLARD